jgi:hypothetical protein
MSATSSLSLCRPLDPVVVRVQQAFQCIIAVFEKICLEVVGEVIMQQGNSAARRITQQPSIRL